MRADDLYPIADRERNSIQLGSASLGVVVEHKRLEPFVFFGRDFTGAANGFRKVGGGNRRIVVHIPFKGIERREPELSLGPFVECPTYLR
jgi:hypothetical protein